MAAAKAGVVTAIWQTTGDITMALGVASHDITLCFIRRAERHDDDNVALRRGHLYAGR